MMGADKGRQKGAQDHAEGEHGDKTRDALLQQLRSGPHEPPAESHEEIIDEEAKQDPQRHRLHALRKQHDDAEMNSDINQLRVRIEPHDPAAQQRDASRMNSPGGGPHPVTDR